VIIENPQQKEEALKEALREEAKIEQLPNEMNEEEMLAMI